MRKEGTKALTDIEANEISTLPELHAAFEKMYAQTCMSKNRKWIVKKLCEDQTATVNVSSREE
jgi:hypothetical protein